MDEKIYNVLRQQIIPNNIMNLNVNFDHINELKKSFITNKDYNVFKLANLSIIGSSCWLNISDKIGNNKFILNNSREHLSDLDYKIGYFNRDLSNDSIIKSTDYSKIYYKPIYSNEFSYSLGDINYDTGNLISSSNSYTITGSVISPESSFKVSVLNNNFKYKISLYENIPNISFDYYKGGSDNDFNTYQKTYPVGTPLFYELNGIKSRSFYVAVITIRSIDDKPFNEEVLKNNKLFEITQLPPISNTVILNDPIKIIGNYDNVNGSDVSIRYGYTFDYVIRFSFFNPDDNTLIERYNLNINPDINNKLTMTFNKPLEGSNLIVDVVTLTNRDFNSGDLTNITYILKDLILGNIFDDEVVIPDGFYSGIYNSPADTNPVNKGVFYIYNLIKTKIPALDFTLNNDNTVNIINSSNDNIIISFSGKDSNSSNRFLGFYDIYEINIPGNSTIKSPNSIDLDSNGRFDKIFISVPQIGLGYINEPSFIISLQKGNFYFQNISNTERFEKILFNTQDILFKIVDGKNRPIEINDNILLTGQINCYNI